MKRHGYIDALWIVLLLALLSVAAAPARAQIKVNVGVEKEDVAVNEPFLFRIEVDGTNTVQAPDLAALTDDFNVEFLGPRQNNSQSITIINGQRSEVVKRVTYLNFRLRALKTGTLVIPEAQVMAEGRPYTSRSVPIRVTESEPNENFILTSTLSKNSCYVGETVVLTTTLYAGQDVKGISFNLPSLSLENLLSAAAPALKLDPNNNEWNVGGEPVEAEQGKVTRDGETFLTLTIRHYLVPQGPGTMTLPRSTLSGEGATGRYLRTRSLFGGTRAEYESVFVQAEPLTLEVEPLPEKGKPANFSGLVGEFDVSTTASPTTINVGDPITLGITVTSPSNLGHFELPALQQQAALAESFRIPDEMAPGVVGGETKRFTQTVRALSVDVAAVPPIEIPYFDSRSGTYTVARSEPIPLTVREATMVTAHDAEGFRPTAEAVEHLAVNEGIAHNFTGAEALKPQRFGPDVWLRTAGSWLFLLLPPLLFAVLAAGLFFRARGGIFAIDRSQAQALPLLESTLTDLDTAEEVYNPSLDALRAYLGTRLKRQGSALTFDDAEEVLRGRGVGEDTLQALKKLFDECEAHRYAGGAGVATENSAFLTRSLECLRTLDQELGR
jgi:hypothetical protein